MDDKITEDIKKSIYDMNYDNIHFVAEYMFEKLDKKVIEALVLELEAQFRFGDKK